MSKTHHDESGKLLDQLGMGLSFLCLIHCLAMPMVMLSLPILARYYLGNPFVHLALAFLIIPVGLISFYRGFIHHRSYKPLFFGIVGMFFISFVPAMVHLGGFQWPETPLVIGGSLIMIYAHYLNRKCCSTCRHN